MTTVKSEFKIPCQVTSFLTTHILTREQLVSDLEEMIGSDFWGCYSKSQTTEHLKDAKIFVEHPRKDSKGMDCKIDCSHCSQREKFLSNSQPLLSEIENGRILVCVLGDDDFAEVSYIRIGTSYLKIQTLYTRMVG